VSHAAGTGATLRADITVTPKDGNIGVSPGRNPPNSSAGDEVAHQSEEGSCTPGRTCEAALKCPCREYAKGAPGGPTSLCARATVGEHG
jgi:hypothetical protein